MTRVYTLLLIFLCLFFPCSGGVVPANFPDYCPTTICNGVPISYPFWRLDNASLVKAFCGYQGFGLTCSPSNDTYPIFALPNNNYYVKHINYTSKSVTLIDIDVVGHKCPRAKHNVTIGDSLPLDYNPGDVNITFYFNCTLEGDYVPPVASKIMCLEPYMAMKPSYVFLDNAVPGGINWGGSCEDTVISTVRETEVTMSNLTNQFTNALNTGFVLDWDMEKACTGCESTGGLCGFNNKTQNFLCLCEDGGIRLSKSSSPYCKGKSNIIAKIYIPLVLVIGSAILGSVVLYLRMKLRSGICSGRSSNDRDIKNFIKQHGSLAPKRFSYSDVKMLTRSFGQELGKGGFGTVYKGKLPDGTLVAVKILKASRGNGEEFINEVASISRTSHVNIVNLIGYCFEGHKRALIYEYMSHGSLDRFLKDHNSTGGNERRLGWDKLYRISIGIASGLEYLHRGCNTRILHFDIKPQNILLDDEFCPKISDFGLSKLCHQRESIVSMLVARGTVGYIAPEVFYRSIGDVSHKSDVYSYGMMLMEMVGRKKLLKVDAADRSSEIYFHDQVYRLIDPSHNHDVYNDLTEEDKEIARKMALVGVWCIQIDPKQRPNMKCVIDMLEGSSEALPIPPKPVFCPPRSRNIDSSSTVESV